MYERGGSWGGGTTTKQIYCFLYTAARAPHRLEDNASTAPALRKQTSHHLAPFKRRLSTDDKQVHAAASDVAAVQPPGQRKQIVTVEEEEGSESTFFW